MKGLVFTEFMELVEKKFGMEMVDDIIDATAPESDGSYTAVGTYDYNELVAYVVELSQRTQIPAPDLIHTFGLHLSQVFATKFSDFFINCQDTISFLKTIDHHIHVEVKKLYPDAEVPQFTVDESDPNTFKLIYESKRGFADLAHGLIDGCAKYYQESFDIQREDQSTNDNHKVIFSLQRLT